MATGHDEVLAVDWKGQKLSGAGATWENTPQVRNFLARRNATAAPYADDLGKLDWVIATRPPDEGRAVEIPADRFGAGLTTTFYEGDRFENKIYERTDRSVDFYVPDGAIPDPKVNILDNYTVRWDGKITPPATGDYTL